MPSLSPTKPTLPPSLRFHKRRASSQARTERPSVPWVPSPCAEPRAVCPTHATAPARHAPPRHKSRQKVNSLLKCKSLVLLGLFMRIHTGGTLAPPFPAAVVQPRGRLLPHQQRHMGIYQTAYRSPQARLGGREGREACSLPEAPVVPQPVPCRAVMPGRLPTAHRRRGASGTPCIQSGKGKGSRHLLLHCPLQVPQLSTGSWSERSRGRNGKPTSPWVRQPPAAPQQTQCTDLL